MKDKFYNYLYDYMVKENLIKDKTPNDQKEKRLYVIDYLKKFGFISNEVNIFDRFIISSNDIPEVYFKNQEKMDSYFQQILVCKIMQNVPITLIAF